MRKNLRAIIPKKKAIWMVYIVNECAKKYGKKSKSKEVRKD